LNSVAPISIDLPPRLFKVAVVLISAAFFPVQPEE